MALSTQGYKGTRDFYPQDMRLFRHVFGTAAQVVQRFGYEEYQTPLLELTDNYRAKTGEEIVNEQTYTFEDRGGREVSIRPELTPSTARMVAARMQELAYPVRWYNVSNFMRYERPQKGRLREFWQLNADLFGVTGIDAEVEIILIASNIMRSLGATDDMFEIRISSRKLLSVLLGEYLGLDVENARKVTKLVDRKAKMSDEAFRQAATELMGEDSYRLMELLTINSIDDLPTTVVESGLAEELRTLFSKLHAQGVTNIVFDITLMRGFDYYTGVVFEVFDKNPDNTRSLFGGGRYDELLTSYGAPKVPAIGFGMGDVTLMDFLSTHQLLPETSSEVRAVIAPLEDTAQDKALSVANDLRSRGLAISIDPTLRKIDKILSSADKQGAPYVVFIGSKELLADEYMLRTIGTSETRSLKFDELLDILQNQ